MIGAGTVEITNDHGGSIDLAGRFRLAAGVRVVRRSADSVQIGAEPPRWRILHRAPHDTAAVLDGLDGSASLADALVEAQADVGVWHPLLTELRDVGLLVADGDWARPDLSIARPGLARSAGSPPPLRTTDADWRGGVEAELSSTAVRYGPRAARGILLRRHDAIVVIAGVGALADAVAELLSASGIGSIRCETGTQFSGDRQGRGGRAAPEQPPPTLVVLAGAAPPPEELAALVRARRPHVGVHASLTVAVLGPFVLPGLSTCLLCILRHRNDLDLGWPAVEAGLRSDPVEPPAALRALAAAAATAEVLRAVDGLATPATLDATLEWRGDELIPRRRSFAPHPGCDCAAIGRRPDSTSPSAFSGGRQ